MIAKGIARYLHITHSCWAAEKSSLATLRKKTGYTFSNCKKALELNNYDLLQAENWLNKQAQSLGWSKATKLEGRQTTQGLVAVVINKNNGALVEVNCETDFVAKNTMFHEMVGNVARACLCFVEKQSLTGGPLTKICLDQDQLRQLPSTEGKTLADQLALTIGLLGENATLRRAMCLKTNSQTYLSGYAHPKGIEKGGVLLGRFGGLIALQQKEHKNIDIQDIGKSLCQHVVGMDPKKIGTIHDEPANNSDDETCLIHQEFLLDESLTVKDVLEQHGLEVIDFKRFECGENLMVGVPLSEVHTCQ